MPGLDLEPQPCDEHASYTAPSSAAAIILRQAYRRKAQRSRPRAAMVFRT
jgi:hypothetical protein